MKNFVWRTGGPQGSGVDSGANIFARACCYGGLHVYGKREYHSNVKGLHSYFNVRVSPKPVGANVDKTDLLATFDGETIIRHIWDVSSKGGIILDEKTLETKINSIPTLPLQFKRDFQKQILESRGINVETINDLLDEVKKSNVKTYLVPYHDLLREIADETHEKLSKLTKMLNVLTLGVSFGIINYNPDLVEKAIKFVFSAKPKIIQTNLLAFNKAYNYAQRNFKHDFDYKPVPVSINEERTFLQGFQAVALGKLVGGCRFQTYYPITPAADESLFLEENEIFELTSESNGSLVVMQTEDEIAAINMASGASLTGTRAATSTSGPGFSLMVEGLGWAGNNEVPLVINYYQRGAPSTGLPTRQGQDDLQFVMHASHGEFPRIILCSGDIEECFYDAARAFNYAEKYQTPVIHLIDKTLANSSKSFKSFDSKSIKINRGEYLSAKDVKDTKYKRFKFTPTGVSPRVALGTTNIVFWNTGDEHDERGNISENPKNRTLMVEKRMKKLDLANKEIPLEERINFFGAIDAPATIVSWGSTKGAILEAMERLNLEGYKLNFIQIRVPLPLPVEYLVKKLGKANHKKIVVEGNYSGQLAKTIREETSIAMDYFVLKWNGRSISVDELYTAFKLIMLEKAPKRQVLTHGN
jgi:2-oxoglutarate ferredoxin oxidoreductase subunit alpha